jgi:GMP synthase-like glutamine amidotransferase
MVQLVLTEHPAAVTRALAREYERLRRLLARLAAAPVRATPYTELADLGGARAVVLSGSYAPWSAHERRALARLGDVVRGYDGPVLGICAGMQLQVAFAGGAIAHRERPRVGFARVDVLDDRDLLRDVGPAVIAYEHHTDQVVELPDELRVLARSPDCPVEAIALPGRRWWGTQFHPERFTPEHPAGEAVLRAFLALSVAPGVVGRKPGDVGGERRAGSVQVGDDPLAQRIGQA